MDTITRTDEEVRGGDIGDFKTKLADALINPPHPHKSDQHLQLGRDQAGNDCYFERAPASARGEWSWFRPCTEREVATILAAIKAGRKFEAYAGPAHGALHYWDDAPADES